MRHHEEPLYWIDRYENLSEFIDRACSPCEEDPPPFESRASQREGTGFYAHNSFDSALKSYRKGDQTMAREISSFARATIKTIGSSLPTIEYDPSIAATDLLEMGEYCSGNPECYLSPYESLINAPSPESVTILVNYSTSAGVDKSLYTARGKVAVTLAHILELAGRPTEIILAEGTRGSRWGNNSKAQYDTVTPVKRFSQPSDLPHLCWAIADIDMLRRFSFSVAEHYPRDVRQAIGIADCGGNYGSPCNVRAYKDRRRVIIFDHAHSESAQWTNEQTAKQWILDTLKKHNVNLRGV